MYRPSAFAVDDMAVLHDVIRKRAFATLAVISDGAVRFAYAPVVLDAGHGALGGIRYHLAVGNPLTRMEDDARIAVSIAAADAYVSPDWYRKLVTVPTWNYVAVEGEGRAHRLSRDALRQAVIDLSAQEEAKLAPKPQWRLDKLPPERTEALLNGIVGFSLAFERLQGKFKLSQDKSRDDFDGVVAGLEARGDAASLAVAKAMRATAP